MESNGDLIAPVLCRKAEIKIEKLFYFNKFLKIEMPCW
jgi:hypothetical protein